MVGSKTKLGSTLVCMDFIAVGLSLYTSVVFLATPRVGVLGPVAPYGPCIWSTEVQEVAKLFSASVKCLQCKLTGGTDAMVLNIRRQGPCWYMIMRFQNTNTLTGDRAQFIHRWTLMGLPRWQWDFWDKELWNIIMAIVWQNYTANPNVAKLGKTKWDKDLFDIVRLNVMDWIFVW